MLTIEVALRKWREEEEKPEMRRGRTRRMRERRESHLLLACGVRV